MKIIDKSIRDTYNKVNMPKICITEVSEWKNNRIGSSNIWWNPEQKFSEVYQRE
jgi:hypothetical protein